MSDPLPPPPPSAPPSTANTPTQSPSPSPRKSLSSSNHTQSGSPSNSIGTDSKSSTPRPYSRRSSKTIRSSISALNKSPVLGPSLDASIGDSAHTANTVPNISLHSSRDVKKEIDYSYHQGEYIDDTDGILPDPRNPDHRSSLPRPLPSAKCPLLCVFYAEFDIVVGPMVCFQSPSKFMFSDINVGQNEINQSLEESFQHIMQSYNTQNTQTSDKGASAENIFENHVGLDDYWNWATEEISNSLDTQNHDADLSSQSTLQATGNKAHRRRNTDGVFAEHLAAATLARSPSFTSSKGASLHEDSTVDSETLQNSIFAACSEYIITGNELANQTITVSTRGMHILSRPMIISDTKRYERNSLLFSVGFVLRRNIDPRPWWPVLSNLSRTFRAMEVESEFLSHQRTRPMIQTVLEDILVSLNSKQIDCHLLLDEGNLLNLQLFQPPPPPTPPVPDFAVPILLKPEWQLQLYDWDLTINWILPHIDGCKHVKQIAQSSEVDMELVRSCLRVLKHHDVLSYVDIFRYSNVYECTPLGLQLLSPLLTGDESKEGSKILDEGFWYAVKKQFARQAPSKIYREMHALTNSGNSNSPGSFSTSPLMNSVLSRRHSQQTAEDYEPCSFPNRSHNFSIAEEHTRDDKARSKQSSPRVINSCGSAPKSTIHMNSFVRDAETIKKALAGLYCSCTRDHSFGDILLAKVGTDTTTEATDRHDVSLHSLDSSSMAPLCETADLEIEQGHSQSTTEAEQSKNNASDIDWTKTFHLDHRRMITFGIAHNLIHRVHQFPLASEAQNDDVYEADKDHIRRKSSMSHDYNTGSIDHVEFSAELFDEQQPIHTTDSVVTPTLSQSSLQINDVDRDSSRLFPKKSNISFVERVALSMDGTRCDDELSCMFETPIEDLVALLKSTGRWNVISVFSPDSK